MCLGNEMDGWLVLCCFLSIEFNRFGLGLVATGWIREVLFR